MIVDNNCGSLLKGVLKYIQYMKIADRFKQTSCYSFLIVPFLYSLVAYQVSLVKPGCPLSKYLQQDQTRLIVSEAYQQGSVRSLLLHPNLTKKLAMSGVRVLDITGNWDI